MTRRETIRWERSRAVSPWFRAFGRREEKRPPEEVKRAKFPGSDRVEFWFLGVTVPLVAGAACFDALWRWGGAWAAWIGVLPTLFLLLHVLVFAWRMPTPRRAFWGWSALLLGWCWWLLERGGETPVRWVAWGWVAFAALQLPAAGVLGWRRAMAIEGKAGIRVRVGLAIGLHVLLVAAGWRWGWAGVALAGVGIAALGCGGTLVPGNGWFGPVARRVRGKAPLITIDDGPDPDETPALLDLLDAHGRQAVFFVIGEKVRRFPELAREIVRRGHELGNHTMTHPQATMWALGPRRTRREIEECQRAIREVAGVEARWFRAPVGHRNFFTHPVTRALGLEVVAWSRRGFDTRPREIRRIVDDLTAGSGEGEILLVHEGTGRAREVLGGVLARLAREDQSSSGT